MGTEEQFKVFFETYTAKGVTVTWGYCDMCAYVNNQFT